MNDKAEEVLDLSDGDAGDCDGTVSPTPATVPKKRGRPANTEKLKKAFGSPGRGRPAKGLDGGVTKKVAKAAEASDEEDRGSDDGSPVPNVDSIEVVSPGRGRQPKGKRKLKHTIVATGKGRGRPKKLAKTDAADDDDEDADDNDDGASSDYKPGKKAIANKAAKKGRGRPKKVQNSDDESSDDKMDDDAEKRPLGRPPSGGINLNIVRTGRGQGRPKKTVAAKRAALVENGGSPRGRGRPSLGKKAYVPTGKPRGRRPKETVQEKDSPDDEDEDEDEENTDENSLKKDAVNNSADDDKVEKNSDDE